MKMSKTSFLKFFAALVVLATVSGVANAGPYFTIQQAIGNRITYGETTTMWPSAIWVRLDYQDANNVQRTRWANIRSGTYSLPWAPFTTPYGQLHGAYDLSLTSTGFAQAWSDESDEVRRFCNPEEENHNPCMIYVENNAGLPAGRAVTVTLTYYDPAGDGVSYKDTRTTTFNYGTLLFRPQRVTSWRWDAATGYYVPAAGSLGMLCFSNEQYCTPT